MACSGRRWYDALPQMAGSGIYCDNNKKVIDHVARQATKKTKKAKSHHHDDDVISQIDVSQLTE
jgi:hypothetical protein